MPVGQSAEIGRRAGQGGGAVGTNRDGDHAGLLEKFRAQVAVGVQAGGPGGAEHQRDVCAPACHPECPPGGHGAGSSALG